MVHQAISAASSLIIRYAISVAQAAEEWLGGGGSVGIRASAWTDNVEEDDIGAVQVGEEGAGADNFGVGGAGGPSSTGKEKIWEGDGGAKNVRADKVGARGPGSVGGGLRVPFGNIRPPMQVSGHTGSMRSPSRPPHFPQPWSIRTPRALPRTLKNMK